jgi:hypothetical protein
MLEIFKSMVKEEWRIHSCMFGGFMFAMFPVLLTIITFLFSLTLPIFTLIIPTEQILIILQYTFVLFGLSVGSFGLLGRDIMNRRFGNASLVAYSSRSLPVSERIILANFFVKDVIYYFFLWIAPFVVGFAVASLFLSIGFVYSLSLLLILTLSFLIGLSVSFLLSTIYAHSTKLLLALLAFSALIVLSAALVSNPFLITLMFSYIPTANQILFSVLFIAILLSFSLMYPKIDYPQKKKLYKNSLKSISEMFSFKNSLFVSKDFLDFNRSEGGVGKIILSFLVPLGMIWLLIFVFIKFVPVLNLLIIFSIFLGTISTSFYNWFTQYDSFNFYAFLPIKVSEIIRGKVKSFAIINLVSLAVLTIVATWTGQLLYFVPALISFIAIASYALSITIYLAGLSSNILLYNAKIFSKYLLYISPMLLAMIFLSIVGPFYLAFSIILVPLSYEIIKASYDKWDKQSQPTF